MPKVNAGDESLIRRATYASVGVAAILIGVKFFGWWITHSVSLQASLIDSLLDAFASVINMVAVYHALKPADKEHRFGHGKAESLAALGQALFIGGSSLWLLFEARNHFLNAHQVQASGIGLCVMGVAMVITLWLIFYQGAVVKKTGSVAISADRVHYQSDLMVNMAVILSLLSAEFFHIEMIDPICGLLIGIYILWTAWKITLHAFNVLMDRELENREREKILSITRAHPEVRGVRDLRTRSSGLQQFIQLRLLLDANLSLSAAHSVAQSVEKEIVRSYPSSQVMIRLVPSSPERKAT